MKRDRVSGMRRRNAAQSARGLVLFVVLVIIALLTLLAAGYAYLVRAELKNVEATTYDHQAMLAAESGRERFIAEYRLAVGDPDRWNNNPNAFRGWKVRSADDDEDTPGTGGSTLRQAHLSNALTGSARDQKKNDTPESSGGALAPAWRFNLVAADFDHPGEVRYGATSECGKLDINRASADQLRRLFTEALAENNAGSSLDAEIDVDELVDSLLDWRSAGTAARPKGAKDDWYMSNRRPGYRCKGAPFETVDELLLVRGFTAQVLYGEDVNRNGLLDANEDDGDASFPPDNSDGILNRGLAPYLTVWSRDYNVNGMLKPRININMRDVDELEKQLATVTELSADVSSFIVEQRRAGRRFADPLDLVPIPPEEEETEEGKDASTQPADGSDGQDTGEKRGEGNGDSQDMGDEGKKSGETESGANGETKPESKPEQPSGGKDPGFKPGDSDGGLSPVKPAPGDNNGGFSPGKPSPGDSNNPKKDEQDNGKNPGKQRQKEPDNQNGNQGGRNGPTVNPRGNGQNVGGRRGPAPQPTGDNSGQVRQPRGQGRQPGQGGSGAFGGQNNPRGPSGNRPPQNRQPNGQPRGGNSGPQSGSDTDVGRPSGPGNSTSSSEQVGEGGQGRGSGQQGQGGRRGQQQQPQGPPPPGTIDDLPVILDRLTTQASPISAGRIDINSAPKPVLMTLDLNEDQVNHLIEVRAGLQGAARVTPAWLAAEGVVSLNKLRALLPRITAKSATYSIESVGYADHVDTVKRIYMVLEMRGPIGQVLYYRDLSGLGPAYHPRDEETRGTTNQSFR